ncbi:hypothetical protein J8L97_23070, partial [Pseudoalteromonas sp. MMG012]|nr:hypothetical protein [Pseudoalteromonas sp. MMG012]
MSDLSVTDMIDLKVQQQSEMADMQDVLLAIGQLQAFSQIRKYTTVGEILTYKKIKNSKKYKGIPYIGQDGESLIVRDLKDLCKAFFGLSYSSMEEKLGNLEAFGEEFLEASNRIGISVQTLRSLKELPKDEQAFIIESQAVESGDKEAIQELIDDLKSKHKKDK